MPVDLAEARKRYDKYIEEGLSQNPPFKGYGMKLIQFAIDYPEDFSALFLNQNKTIEETLQFEGHYDDIIYTIMESMHLQQEQAKWLHSHMTHFGLGIGSLIINKSINYSFEDLSNCFGTLCRALLISAHSPFDSRTELMPEKGTQIPGSFISYSNLPLNKISCLGEDDVHHQIDITSILYFEADGDLVFAYTKKEIYRVKQRLYQLENATKGYRFMKASKAFLVNTSKIDSYRTSENGRIYLKMQNGEEILASRMYSKDVINEIN